MTTTRRGSVFALVLFVATWSGTGCTFLQSNLDCCEGNPGSNVALLTCWRSCYFRYIPAPLPPNLKQLWIRQQNITNIKAGDFPRRDILESLSIWDSNVAVLQPGAFEGLPSMTALDLRLNKIRQLEAETFKGLVLLNYINLDGNEIHHIDGKAFAGLVRLKTLGLNRNCLSSVPRGIRSTLNVELQLTENPMTSIGDVDELRHISSLRWPVAMMQMQCDCKLREMKRFLLENQHLRWHIWCVMGDISRGIRYVAWEDLRCSSPDVSLTLNNGAATGEVSFTCRTDCKKGLAFSWIAPSGDHRPPSFEYSMDYRHVSNSSCKGSPVTTWETRRMCYSVLDIPAVGRDADGKYTCQVTADHTDNASVSTVLTLRSGTGKSTRGYSPALNVSSAPEKSTRAYSPELQPTVIAVTPPTGDRGVGTETTNRPGIGLSTARLILAGLGSFCGFFLMFVVIAACVSRCKAGGAEGHHDTDEPPSDDARRGQYENDDQFSDTDEARGRQYENDDQLSDTDLARSRPYENDDQFSDTEKARTRPYENDDQFSDADGARGRHYENEDQFSDEDGARGGHYENDDQFSDSEEAKGRHYENDDQFSDDDVSKPSHRTAPGNPTSGRPGKTSSTDRLRAKRIRRRYDKRGVVKTRAMSNNKTARAVLRIVTIHAEAQAGGQYDNERKTPGRDLGESNVKTTPSAGGESDNRNQTVGHYDNDKNLKSSAQNTSMRTDDDSDSDHDYMSLPEHRATGQETGRGEEDVQCESLSEEVDPVPTSASAAESDSDHDYMSLPQNREAGRGAGHGSGEGNVKDEDKDPVSTSASAAEGSEHGYMRLPRTENADDDAHHTYVTFPGTENAGNNFDHTYMTFPDTENADDNSDQIATFPDSEDAEGQEMETKQKEGHVPDLATGLSDEQNGPGHVYVTFPESETDKGEETKFNAEDRAPAVSNLNLNSDHGDVAAHDRRAARDVGWKNWTFDKRQIGNDNK
ncbi:SLIT3 [Branchiostoma lanceolatum]|uniref:SLIT3 protein n=1 Tax=Branchiostoma lanceolatum TaxID=7740 RepID=A0A8J9W7K6_BRALA|nr:SLIT3 [Branchiostoma lanceolatum]